MWLTSPKKYRSGQLEIAACSAEFGQCSLGRLGCGRAELHPRLNQAGTTLTYRALKSAAAKRVSFVASNINDLSA
jgi:hypothetical protein